MSTAVSPDGARSAVEKLRDICADLRSCAIVGADGEVLAMSSENGWGAPVEQLWRAADEAGGGEVLQVHVATGGGELFAARSHEGGATAVATTNRFALASLMFCDLRAVLRDLELVAGPAPEGGDR
ncbi:MAG: hypothetical protein H0V25_05035 [Solirubrobacterales bacterium]|nr:hypothetical protein [Solirubrobacterales bacterium]